MKPDQVIIAEFMGIHVITLYNDNNPYYIHNCPIMEDYEGLPDYEGDYNELMKVVEKIQETDVVEINNLGCTIITDIYEKFYIIKVEKDEPSKMKECIYAAVLKYIEESNKKDV